MKYVDEYRDSTAARRLVDKIGETATRRWTLMEVCGGQTHGLLRHGIDEVLKDSVRLIHGPGCPVCVTPLESIDWAIQLAQRPNVLLTSFGDMLRVPGSRVSLLQARASGANVQIVYSPLDAVELARKHPDKQVIFFAVGFETTTPATALAACRARNLGLENFSMIVAHVRVQPAMEMLASSDDNTVEGFLAAGHVCTVAGYDSYEAFCKQYHLPVVVTGFEPVDLLSGILECVRQLEDGEASVCNRYGRSVAAPGNEHAKRMIEEVYEVCDRPWRGLGVIPNGGLSLREEWRQFDATRRFEQSRLPIIESERCRSGQILTGRIKPTDCECFAVECKPENPLGAPMVSDEGTCAAYYRYASHRAAPASKD